MPEEGYDVYIVTKSRTRSVIDDFINEFVDLDQARERPDEEELMLLPLGASPTDAQLLDDYDWEPSVSIEHIVDRGMDQPWRAFFVPDLPARRPDVLGVTIGFTLDGCFVAGIEAPTLDAGVAWLCILAEQLDAEVGAITVYAPWFSLPEAIGAIDAGFPKVHVAWRRGLHEPKLLTPSDIRGH